MTTTEACPQCGQPLPGVGIPCPACLLELGRRPSAPSAPVQFGRSAVPTLEELRDDFPALELLEFIGRGGMGFVYRARQRDLGREVALKVLPDECAAEPSFAERFEREARVLAKLDHPNIVRVFDAGRNGTRYWLTMEFVDGTNLRQVIESWKMDNAQALAAVIQICDALQYAHGEGVVHRDIKPENILLDKQGRVKIADFGLAKLLGGEAQSVTLTRSDQALGTPQYMAPEQVRRPLEVDHRADLYSLGVVFYELLTGELPMGNFPLPSDKSGVDARLDEVVLKTLETDPERRYQRASELGEDVRHVSNTEAAADGACSSGRWPSSRSAAPAATPQAADRARGHKACGLGCGCLLAILIGMLLLLLPALFLGLRGVPAEELRMGPGIPIGGAGQPVHVKREGPNWKMSSTRHLQVSACRTIPLLSGSVTYEDQLTRDYETLEADHRKLGIVPGPEKLILTIDGFSASRDTLVQSAYGSRQEFLAKHAELGSELDLEEYTNVCLPFGKAPVRFEFVKSEDGWRWWETDPSSGERIGAAPSTGLPPRLQRFESNLDRWWEMHF